MTNENNIETAAEMADKLIDQLDQETDVMEHARKSIDGAHEMLKVLEKSILHYIDTIKDTNCECPLCAETMRQFEHARNAVQTVERGLPTETKNPMESSFLLGTSSALCAFMPTLILSILQTGNVAHEAIAMVVRSKVEGFVHCQTGDLNKKPN